MRLYGALVSSSPVTSVTATGAASRALPSPGRVSAELAPELPAASLLPPSCRPPPLATAWGMPVATPATWGAAQGT